jgi:hypothetical protein
MEVVSGGWEPRVEVEPDPSHCAILGSCWSPKEEGLPQNWLHQVGNGPAAGHLGSCFPLLGSSGLGDRGLQPCTGCGEHSGDPRMSFGASLFGLVC